MKDQGSGRQDVITIARGGSFAFVGRLSALALNYMLALILARGLGANDYGLFVVGFSLVMLIGSVMLLGLNRGTVRYIALYRGIGDRRRELGTFKTSIQLVLLSSFASAGLLVLLAKPLSRLLNVPSGFVGYVWGFALWIPIWVLIYELAAVLEAIKCLKYRTLIVDIGWPLARVLLTGGVLILGSQLIGVIWANLLASVLAMILIAAVVYRVFLRGLKDVCAESFARQLLVFSIPVMLFNLLNLSQNQVDIYLLSALKSSAATGIFNVAARTTILVVAFLEGLGFIFSPFVSDLTNQRRMTELNELMSTVTRWSLMFGLPISLAIILFNQPILRLFGDAFLVAAPALIILAIAQSINAATGPVGIMLTMSGHSKLNLFNAILTLVINIILDLLLIPPLGILGAAIGSGIAISLVNLLRTVQVYRILHIWPYNRQFLKPVAAAVVAALVTYVLINARGLGSVWLDFAVGLVIFFSSYVVGILLLGLSESDLLVLRTLRERVLGQAEQV